ncbi:protein-glutamate methylesterase/protein-glutamine glutaminase [Melioribacter sp. OK-6-Me]|uniref:protein-glutamate methylesterase/protein-glutamine glutaminase n=1 Tax=unclassified Melioribacter TaxID=2627329 RepID=UPI003EDB15BC
MHNISVLVVDDSAFMRKSISLMLESDPSIKVVATARNGQEGVELAQKLRPDLITMDIEMPVMDGLTALKKIMDTAPTSVIMISSLTTEGAEATIKAMELGAVDFIPKELSYVNVNIGKIKEDLITKVKEITRHKLITSRLDSIRNLEKKKPVYISGKELPKLNYNAISIGISTGGPLSLQKIIPNFSGEIHIPIFIVQHMPPKFTKSLADRLNTLSQLEVKEAEDGEVVRGGVVYLAPGGMHMKLKKVSNLNHAIEITPEPATTLHRPSVDVTMTSVVEHYGKNTLAIIMTGMGKDGLEAVKLLKSKGGIAIAQDEETCVVYGMPKAIVEAGLADLILPLEKIPATINGALVNGKEPVPRYSNERL